MIPAPATAGNKPLTGRSGQPGALAHAPVIVISYRFGGEERLRSLFAGHPGLACTASTGLLPLCHQAAVTWRLLEGRSSGGALSSLAAASIRVFIGSAITTVLARTGKARLCEFAVAPTMCAQTFISVYPQARFLCLHRAPADVIGVVTAGGVSLSSPVLASFAESYPGNAAAAAAAYWAAHTQELIDFQASNPRACLRVRYEDLGTRPEATVSEIAAFLNLDQEASVPAATPRAAPVPGQEAATLPAQLPPFLLSQISELSRQLGY